MELAEGLESLGMDRKGLDSWRGLFGLITSSKSSSEHAAGGAAGSVRDCKSLRTVRVARDCPVRVESLVGGGVAVRRE